MEIADRRRQALVSVGAIVLTMDSDRGRMRYIVIAALVVVACRRQVTSPFGRLEVTAGVVPSSFRTGDKVTVTVVVTNRAGRAQTIETNECFPSFEVTTSDGTVVGPGQRTCSAIAKQTVLEPGRQFVIAQTWSGDAVRAGVDSPAVMLAPGTYLVHGRSFGGEADNPAVAIQINP